MKNKMIPVALLVSIALPVAVTGQQPPEVKDIVFFASVASDVLSWDARVTSMAAGQELQKLAVHEDTLTPGWRHERFQQRYRGLPVFGAQIIRHWKNGKVESVNGQYYENVKLDTTAGIGAAQARLAAERIAGTGAHAVGSPELLVFPNDSGLFLAYKLHVRTRDDIILFFVDASTGLVIDSWSDLRTDEAVVGIGTGTWDDLKKMSTTEQNGTFVARDGLRPATNWTIDVDGDVESWGNYRMSPQNDAARDIDNDWDDGALVDAHVYAGWTYDYYYKRFGRRGLDDANRSLTSYVHFWPRYYPFHPVTNNAFWDPVDMSINYGDGDGKTFTYFSSALDVVAHELTHGVTHFTSGFVYQNESGALDEAFCDIMAIGVEFFFEPSGRGRQRAEWGTGEDVFIKSFVGDVWYAIRYSRNPPALGDPDHYRNLYTGEEDNGGVHSNSTIVSHAFYLFVEGGTNGTSGVKVEGIGFANLENAEQIFYRAFTNYLFPNSTFSDARRVTLQSARDLFGAGGREETQLVKAWNAVGVQ